MKQKNGSQHNQLADLRVSERSRLDSKPVRSANSARASTVTGAHRERMFNSDDCCKFSTSDRELGGIDGRCSFLGCFLHIRRMGVNVKRRGRVWLLSLILLGVCGGAVIAQAAVLTSQAAGRSGTRSATASDTRPDASTVSGYVLTAASSGPVLATTSAVLSQDRENDLWQTTVVLSQVGGECPRPASEFWL
jgi:hypothetical protein